MTIHLDMPADEYHKTAAVSNSILSKMAVSPYHCWATYINPDRPEPAPTAAMRAGTLLHMLVLEPHKVDSAYIVRPDDIDGRTAAGKAWIASAAGREIITEQQMATAQAQRDAIHAVPELAFLLAAGAAEVSAFWTDRDTGLPCRMRADWVHPLPDSRVMLLDLKTTTDQTPDEFRRSVAKYGYHRQAAWYSRGYAAATGREVAEFVLGAVTNAYPFVAFACLLDADAIQQGHDECDELLSRYAECQRANHWPAFTGYQSVSLPAWAKRSEEIEVTYV